MLSHLTPWLISNLMHEMAVILGRLMRRARCFTPPSHANAQEIAKANLGNVVANVLVVHKCCVLDVSLARGISGIGLERATVSAIAACEVCEGKAKHTIKTPASEGWTHLASFHALGPMLPCPHVDSAPMSLASFAAL